MDLKQLYLNHYKLDASKVSAEHLHIMKIDMDGCSDIYNLIMVPDSLYWSFRDINDPMFKVDEKKLSPKQKCDYYRKLADMYEELAIWQLSKDIEDIRLSNPDINIVGIGYEDLR